MVKKFCSFLFGLTNWVWVRQKFSVWKSKIPHPSLDSHNHLGMDMTRGTKQDEFLKRRASQISQRTWPDRSTPSRGRVVKRRRLMGCFFRFYFVVSFVGFQFNMPWWEKLSIIHIFYYIYIYTYMQYDVPVLFFFHDVIETSLSILV